MSECPEWWSAAVEAVEWLKEEGISCSLMGTAALVAHGYAVPVEDLDFYVSEKPSFVGGAPVGGKYGTSRFYSAGWRVDFINAKAEGRERFTDPAPVVIDGVPVANIQCVLRAKAWRDRSKDRAFFRSHPELAALISWREHETGPDEILG